MDNLHPASTWQNIEHDAAISASDPTSSEPFSDKEDVLSHPHLAPQDVLPGIGHADNIDVSCTTEGVPLPIDCFVAIGQYLEPADMPRFFATNSAIHARYGTDQDSYTHSLRKIGSAARFSEVIDALAAIKEYTADQQPFLLRALAQKLRMQTHGPVHGALTEWEECIDAQFDLHDARPHGPERERALQQLIIARGLALTKNQFLHYGEDFDSIVGDRLNTLSAEYWPPIFEAFLPIGEVKDLLKACDFIGKFNGGMPAISSAFALVIANESLNRPERDTALSALLCERFGVSDRCMRDVLDPHVADAFVKMSMQMHSSLSSGWLMANVQRWRQNDENFTSLVVDAFVKSFDVHVYRQLSFSCYLKNDFTALPELERSARERTIQLEIPTISALRNTEKNADAQIDAFLKMIDRIGDGPSGRNYTAILIDIKGLPYVYEGMPLVARPALLHRLIATAQFGRNDRHTADTFISTAIECRDALISAGTQNSPLVSRVSAALIWAGFCLRSHDASAAEAIVSEASDVAFRHVAPKDWGDVLQALIYDANRHALSEKTWEPIDKHTALFVCLPDTSALHLPELTNRIEKIVGGIWGTLPDKAEEGRSRFEVFKQRVGIPPEMGEIALVSIAEALVPNVVAGVKRLEDVAIEASFADPRAITALETALFNRTIRPTLRADSDVDVVTDQYTTRSLYLRQCIAGEVSLRYGLRRTNAIA